MRGGVWGEIDVMVVGREERYDLGVVLGFCYAVL